jgi:hypothetical protein
MSTNKNLTKQVFVNVPFSEKEHAKRKGARFDKYSKCWYFNIDVGESLNKSCRGYPIKQIDNPPSFNEVFNLTLTESHNNADPFSDNEESDTYSNISKTLVINTASKPDIINPKKIYIYDAFQIDIDNFHDIMVMFLKYFYITYDGNKYLLYYCQLIDNRKFYHTTQMEPNLDRAKASCLQAFNHIVYSFRNIPEETINEMTTIKRNVFDEIARNYLAIGKAYEPEDYHCGYDKMLVFNFNGLKSGIEKFIDKCF